MSEAAIRLKQIMEEKGLSQIQLAIKSGVDQSHISRYLSGKYEPKSVQAQKMAHVLGVSPVWLMGIEGIDRNDNPISPDKKPYSPKDIEQAIKLYEEYKKADPQIQKAVEVLLKAPESDS